MLPLGDPQMSVALQFGLVASALLGTVVAPAGSPVKSQSSSGSGEEYTLAGEECDYDRGKECHSN